MTGIRTTAVLLIAAAFAPVSAWGAPAPANPAAIEEIVVTGSRIPRRDYFAVSPIVTVDRDAIERAGVVETKELLNSLPQIDPAVGAGTGNNFGGEAFVNLRALGANRTLVLLNGRRYPAQGINGGANLDGIPPVLIDRVEVITGGASAVYGSDAMAGAVNVILRDDFEGFESHVQYGVTDRGDADQYNVDAVYGTTFAGTRGRLVLFGDYYRRSRVFQDARSFSQSQIISDDSLGQLIEFNSFASEASSIAGVGPFYTFEPDGTPRLFVEPDDRFSLAPFNPLLAPMERYAGSVFAEYISGQALRSRLEVSLTRSRPTQLVADEFFQFVDINVDRPDIAPEFRQILVDAADPDGDGIATIFLARTFSPERGTGIAEHESDFGRVLLGFDGNLQDDWHWQFDASYAKNDRTSHSPNDISVSRLQQGLFVDPNTGDCLDTSRACVPVNPFGRGNLTPEAAAFITFNDTAFTEHSRETHVSAQLGGAMWERGAGELGVSIGAEYRRFEFENRFPNDNIESGDSLFYGRGINPLSGTITVREMYGEAHVPLITGHPWLEYLGLDLGLRASDYDTLDDIVRTWKLGIEWQLLESLRVRAMRQQAIRAPGVSELFRGINFALTDFELGPTLDECSASRNPVDNGVADICIAQGIAADQIGAFEATLFPVQVSTAANPNIRPETAESFTAGVVWNSSRISVALDYFRIEIEDALANADHRDLVRLCFLSRDPNSQACNTFSRAPSGDIDSALITTINSALATSEGIDLAFDVDWQSRLLALDDGDATIQLSLLATHYLETATQGTALLPFLDCAGKFGAFCNLFAYQGSVPDWKAIVQLNYSSGPYAASLRWNYIGSMVNALAEERLLNGQAPGILAVPSVGSQSYVDLSVSRDLGQHIRATAGIDNLFDNDPPLLGSAAREANTDATTYDVLGRRFFLRLTMESR